MIVMCYKVKDQLFEGWSFLIVTRVCKVDQPHNWVKEHCTSTPAFPLPVDRAEKQVPEALDWADRLRPQKERIQMKGIDMGERLEKLRLTIQKTRELANKIKVGVSFLPNTTIEVESPRDLTKAATSTKVTDQSSPFPIPHTTSCGEIFFSLKVFLSFSQWKSANLEFSHLGNCKCTVYNLESIDAHI